jgi:hypothetical protein
VAAPSATSCNPWKVKVLPEKLSFRQLACYQFAELASPGTLLGAGALAEISQLRNSPHMNRRDADDPAVRFEHLYERRASRAGAELLVDYLHHEDPRYRRSHSSNTWRRTGDALLSVFISPDENGKARPALAPIAGSLSSGFVTMGTYQRQAGWSDALPRAAIVYGHYLVAAVFHEFTPELWSLAPPFIRKYR